MILETGGAQHGGADTSLGPLFSRVVRVLVTGGAGFIGSNLTVELVRRGYSVRVLDNFATGHRANLAGLAGAVELVEGDIQSYERVNRAVEGCDVVFHEAALPSVMRSVQDPLTSNATNVIGTLNVLLTARDHDVRRVILASSSSVYGANPGLPKREKDAAVPISPYATAKLAAENYARSFHTVYGLETVSLRYFNVFGPHQDPASEYAAVIPRFISRLAAGDRPVIYGDGEQSRDFTYVDDVVTANLLAMDAHAAAGRVYNIACGARVTLNQLLCLLNKILGSVSEAAYAAPRPGEVKHSLADISQARSDLGYEPSIDLAAGLRQTAAWLLSRSDGDRSAGVSAASAPMSESSLRRVR